jgi:hypothetical protein
MRLVFLKRMQNQRIKEKDPFLKRILVVDDDPDLTLTFKVALEEDYHKNDKIRFEIYTYNNPLVALS